MRGKLAGQLAAFLNLIINVHTDLVHFCTETLLYSQRGFEGEPLCSQSGIPVSSRPAALVDSSSLLLSGVIAGKVAAGSCKVGSLAAKQQREVQRRSRAFSPVSTSPGCI